MPKYDVNNNSVETLLTWIKTNDVVIPEMQRPFVWDASKVRDLIDSLFNGYPVGYIIIWKNPDVKLKDGSISMGRRVVIDGQQRITALTAAIAGLEVINKSYKKIPIQISFDPVERKFEVYNPAIGKDPQWINDISELFQPGFNSFRFVRDYCALNPGLEDFKIHDAISELQQIKTCSIGVIELSHTLSIEEVTDIFIRINSQGVVLSQADFAMSKIASNEQYGGNTIRKTIDYFCHLKERPSDLERIQNNDTDYVTTEEFSKIKWITHNNDEIYVPKYNDVLRVAFTSQFLRGRLSDLVSLLSGRNFETREYEDRIAEESYNKLRRGVLQFVSRTNFERYMMIVKSTGIIDKSLIRSTNVINFGYALYLMLIDKGTQPGKIEDIVRKWIVFTMLTGRYSGSSESWFDYDIKRFASYEDPSDYLKSIEAGELSDAFWEYTLVDRLTTSVASSPYFNLYLMAQIKSGDLGFLSKKIEIQALMENRGDIHHLFPKNYLMKNGYSSKSMYNQIANYALTQQEINIQIKDDAPKVYMEKVYKQIDTKELEIGSITDIEDLKHSFEANCIPQEFETYTAENYMQFLGQRRKLMAKKIKDFYKSL